jgi:hypothetical protein
VEIIGHVFQPWADCLAMLRSEVRSAALTNWQLLQSNAFAHLENARSYVRSTPEIDEAFDMTRQRCEKFAKEIAARGVLYSPSDPASRQARELALFAVDELEQRLRDAKPSEQAIHLGLGW